MLADQYRGLHHFFRQNFSQVTNPPIDSLRESRVMTLKTRLGNLGNVLDQEEGQCRLLQLESPGAADLRIRGHARLYGRDAPRWWIAPSIRDGGDNALRDAVQSIRRQAEDAVRGGAVHIILSDEATGPRSRRPSP